MKTEKYQNFHSWGVPIIEGWEPVSANTFPHKTLVWVRLTRTNFFVGPGDGHLDFEDIGIYDPDDPPFGNVLNGAWQNRRGQGYNYGPPTHWKPFEIPRDVYYAEGSYYSRLTYKGMGSEFYTKWRYYADMFPGRPLTL